MRPYTLLPAMLALAGALAQQQEQSATTASPALVTSALTTLDASGSTHTATVTLIDDSNAQSRQAASSTAPTTSPPPSPTTLIQATRTESVYVPTASSDTSGHGLDVEGGASGSSSSGFSLSKGGMIAIIVVVVGVAVFGVLSITLFVLAKKRQWRVRESIKRASRRLTGRSAGPRTSRGDVDRRKRSGVVAGSKGQRAPPGTPLVQKGTKVEEREMRDLEKGADEGGKGKEEGFLGKMRGNDWR